LRPGDISAVARVANGYAVLQLVPTRGSEAGASIGQTEIPALAAIGSVRYTQSVDGFSEANTLLDGAEKPADWNQHPELVCGLRTGAIDRSRATLERLLGPAGAADRASTPPMDLVQAQYALAQLYAYDGMMDKAVPHYEEAYRVAQAGVPDAAPQMEEAVGIAYFHKAEMEAGLFHAPGDRDLLLAAGADGPPRGTGPTFAPNPDLQHALDAFTRYLQRQPDDLEVKWLLNVAYMEFGGYPARVPPAWLVPPATLQSSASAPRFTDVAAAAGLTSFSSAGGVVVDDFDNDGRLDVLTSNFDSCGSLQLFWRGADGRFVDRSKAAGLSGQFGGLNLVQADYDNDGCTDVLVLRGGWELAQRRSLLKNDCDGTFTDVTAAAGLAVPATSSQTAVWADVDNDGYLDLFVGNEDRPAQLFHNKRDGTFEDVADRAAVARTAFTKAVASADYDNDGYVDFYVTNLGGGNFLYHNNRDGTFTDVAKQAGVPGPDLGFPTWFFDYDNDGWPDLFVSSYYLSVDETLRTYLKQPHNAPTLKLYRNLGNGTFADVTKSVGLDKVFMPMGSNFGDIDNDGYLDIYLGTGSPSYGALVPSALLRNIDGRAFADVTAASGTGELHKGHGVAFADLDNDGDEDLVFKVGGATPGDAHAMRLFENPGSGNDWIDLKLIGVKSNRSAIGARITVTVEGAGAMRTIARTVTSGGSFGASPLEQHVGLGRAARLEAIDVWWPASGTRQHLTGVANNQAIEITEGRSDYRRLSRPPLPLVPR
ncbi:MAG TPA: FG-GAP-like repeat-containing protein, partial [Vicinamibacterales bacterium]|nr:FG-GAP-like repeat-containing protein [Vicinamibacterales bacterium]